jgi:hypothetical protein
LPKKKNIDPMLAIKLNFQDLQIQYVCKNIWPRTNLYNLSSPFSIYTIDHTLHCTENTLLQHSTMHTMNLALHKLIPKINIFLRIFWYTQIGDHLQEAVEKWRSSIRRFSQIWL